jgi:cell division protein FtsN
MPPAMAAGAQPMGAGVTYHDTEYREADCDVEIWLQVGAFTVQESAFALKKRLEKTYPGVAVTVFKTATGIYYRVRVQAAKGSADALASRLAGEGLPVIIIRE